MYVATKGMGIFWTGVWFAYIIVAGQGTVSARAKEVPFAGIVVHEGTKIHCKAGRTYITGELAKGTLVHVENVVQGWYKIHPTAGSYSFVSKGFVDARGRGDSGTVNRNRTAVKAVNLRDKGNSYYTQVHLSKGTQVQILGEYGSYYMIKPPKGAYVYARAAAVERATKQQIRQAQRPDGQVRKFRDKQREPKVSAKVDGTRSALKPSERIESVAKPPVLAPKIIPTDMAVGPIRTEFSQGQAEVATGMKNARQEEVQRAGNLSTASTDPKSIEQSRASLDPPKPEPAESSSTEDFTSDATESAELRDDRRSEALPVGAQPATSKAFLDQHDPVPAEPSSEDIKSDAAEAAAPRDERPLIAPIAISLLATSATSESATSMERPNNDAVAPFPEPELSTAEHTPPPIPIDTTLDQIEQQYQLATQMSFDADDTLKLINLYRSLGSTRMNLQQRELISQRIASLRRRLILTETHQKIAEVRRQVAVASPPVVVETGEDTVSKVSKVSKEPASAVRPGSHVGWLLPSRMYNGSTLPRLFRLVDTTSNRTIFYVRPGSPIDPRVCLGRMVSLEGEVDWDVRLKRRVLRATQIQIVRMASQ